MANTHETARSTEASLREAITQARQVLKDLRAAMREADQLHNQRLTDEAVGERIKSALERGIADIAVVTRKLTEQLDKKMNARYDKTEERMVEIIDRLDNDTDYVTVGALTTTLKDILHGDQILPSDEHLEDLMIPLIEKAATAVAAALSSQIPELKGKVPEIRIRRRNDLPPPHPHHRAEVRRKKKKGKGRG